MVGEVVGVISSGGVGEPVGEAVGKKVCSDWERRAEGLGVIKRPAELPNEEPRAWKSGEPSRLIMVTGRSWQQDDCGGI